MIIVSATKSMPVSNKKAAKPAASNAVEETPAAAQKPKNSRKKA